MLMAWGSRSLKLSSCMILKQAKARHPISVAAALVRVCWWFASWSSREDGKVFTMYCWSNLSRLRHIGSCFGSLWLTSRLEKLFQSRFWTHLISVFGHPGRSGTSVIPAVAA